MGDGIMTDTSDELLRSARSAGIFGGTFDPVHNAHLLLAETAREEFELDLILFMPAHLPPHKLNGRTITPSDCRLEMLRIATTSNPKFAISTYELDAEGISYTVDTLHWLRSTYPTLDLTFLIGGDSARDFHTWREPRTIASLATVGVLERPDISLPPELVPGVGYRRCNSPLIEISSTDIRERVSSGRSIRYRTPDPVIEYLYQHDLYR